MCRGAFLVILGSLLGCHGSPPSQVARSSPPSASLGNATSGHLTMRVDDARPRKIRKSKRDSISVLAMEDVNPPILKLLVNEIERAGKEWPSQPTEVRLHLDWFRVVVKDDNRLQNDAEARYVAPDAHLDEAKNAGEMFGNLLFAGVMQTAVNCFREASAPEFYPVNPNRYSEGATAEFRGRLTVFLANSRIIVVELKESAFRKPVYTDPNFFPWDPIIREDIESMVAASLLKVEQAVKNSSNQEKSTVK